MMETKWTLQFEYDGLYRSLIYYHHRNFLDSWLSVNEQVVRPNEITNLDMLWLWVLFVGILSLVMMVMIVQHLD